MCYLLTTLCYLVQRTLTRTGYVLICNMYSYFLGCKFRLKYSFLVTTYRQYLTMISVTVTHLLENICTYKRLFLQNIFCQEHKDFDLLP